MKGFLTTHRGMEDIAALEVKELIGTTAKTSEACIVFNIKNYEDLFKLCHKSQSAMGVYYLLCEFDFDNFSGDFYKNLEKINFEEWLTKNIQFRVKCIKINNGKLSTSEIEKKAGETIIDHIQKKHGYKQKVNLDDPEITIFAYLTENKCHIGIDFAGFDLSKRTYNIFMYPAAIKGTIAYTLVRLSDYNENEILLDPFSGSGTIPIEAALFASHFPVNFFNREKFIFLKFQKFRDFDFNGLFKKLDNEIAHKKLKIYNIDSSMKYLSCAKKNSKIAGIDKKISFSRMNLEWLDTKFKKGEIDKIVTKLPSTQTKDINKLYNEFFYQTEFILNKKGKMVLIGNKPFVKKYSEKYKFRISDEKSIFSGKKEYEIFVLNK
jgi:23S rRNA G2445 N2-methylase RlmL